MANTQIRDNISIDRWKLQLLTFKTLTRPEKFLKGMSSVLVLKAEDLKVHEEKMEDEDAPVEGS